MLNEKAPTTLYFQLKEILTKQIKNKDWEVNSKIPTERELCEQYKVSRITVRQALDELEKEGFLYRKQGKGTFVTVPKIEQRLNNFYSFSEEIEKMGRKPSTKVLEFSKIKANEEIAIKLGLNIKDDIYSIKRLRLADDEPFAIEISYLPYELFPDLLHAEVEEKGLYNSLKEKFGIIPDEAEESFEAVLVDAFSSNYLNVAKNSAGLLLERFTKSDERIVEYCFSLIRGDMFKYRISLGPANAAK